jgi:hypothetical protein
MEKRRHRLRRAYQNVAPKLAVEPTKPRATGTPLAQVARMTQRRSRRDGRVYRAVTALAIIDEDCEAQARRRAARWHSWLTSSECTFQDRKNFERWCRHPTNAAAYEALCRELGAAANLAAAALLCARRSIASQVNRARREANEL